MLAHPGSGARLTPSVRSGVERGSTSTSPEIYSTPLSSPAPPSPTVPPSPPAPRRRSFPDILPSFTRLVADDEDEGATVRIGASNAASDDAANDGVDRLEARIAAAVGGRRIGKAGRRKGLFRGRFSKRAGFFRNNYNWNNKVVCENQAFNQQDDNKQDEDQAQNHAGEDAEPPRSKICCCCAGSSQQMDPRDVRKLEVKSVKLEDEYWRGRGHGKEISGDVELPSQEGIPNFRARPATSTSFRQVFSREYKIFYAKLSKRYGAGKSREGELIATDGAIPTDHDLMQARNLYDSIPVVRDSELRIAKQDGERIVLGKGNNGAVFIAFYTGAHKGIPEGIALKIFFRSSPVSVRKEALLSILASQGGYAPRIFGIVYLKRIDAYGLVAEFIPKRKNSKNSVEAWTLRMLIHEEKDRPTMRAEDLFRLCWKMAIGLQTIHDQHVVIGDIKTDNILLQIDDKGAINPFFIDYGLSGFYRGKELNVKSRNGTKVRLKMDAEDFMEKFPHYPPEVAKGEPTSKQGDVFGLGRLYMRMFRAIKVLKRHQQSKQFYQAFHSCMRENPQERLRLPMLRERLQEIVSSIENDNRNLAAQKAALAGGENGRKTPDLKRAANGPSTFNASNVISSIRT